MKKIEEAALKFQNFVRPFSGLLLIPDQESREIFSGFAKKWRSENFLVSEKYDRGNAVEKYMGIFCGEIFQGKDRSQVESTLLDLRSVLHKDGILFLKISTEQKAMQTVFALFEQAGFKKFLESKDESFFYYFFRA